MGAAVVTPLRNQWLYFAVPWMGAEDQSKVFIREISTPVDAIEFLEAAQRDVRDRNKALSGLRIVEILSCSAMALKKWPRHGSYDHHVNVAKLANDVRDQLYNRIKLLMMQQGVIFFILIALVVLILQQAWQGQGKRADHRLKPLERVNFK